MIRRSLLATLGVLALFLVGTVSAFAWPEELQGAPELTPESPAGYYLWYDENGGHLRTHGPGDEHHFTARLQTDGVFVDVDSVRAEKVDDFAVLGGGHLLVLRFHTFDAMDGVNFHIAGGSRLRLNLQLNGEPIATDSIFLGPDGHHPESNPFTVLR